ncbi:transcriptional regulator [Ruminococcus sp. CAG:60]|nr:MurR/RpiR family transcriptional regulator [uncultured Blautia sp.]CCY34359.1 transcriptional regulator [Ruminococcus sp. CAG:60]
MASNILESITAQYHSLTRSGKKLADYIFAHTGEAQYFSISTLAENSGVSEASITRFCHGLGLAGYNDFKLALAKTDHVTDMGELSDSPQGIASEDSLNTIFQKIHKASVLSLNETLELLNEDAINKAVDLLVQADRVFCFGNGGSMVMAMEAWARFSTATSRFVHVSDSHMQIMNTALATSRDVLLVFSYSGSTKDMEDTLQIAREHGVSIILVTHYPNSRAAQFADVVLLCGYNEGPLQSGSIPAKVGQLLLIDCLFYGFCRRNPEASAAARSATAEAVARKML